MTRIWAISDFQGDINRHGGFFKPEVLPDADVLVVAGDFRPPLHQSVMALLKISFKMPVVYVPGNRDYYSSETMSAELQLARAAAATAQGKGVFVLDDEAVVVAGTRFVGATLWTDMAYDGGPEDEGIRRLADFHVIQTDEGHFSPLDYKARHAASRRFIEGTLAAPFDGPTVVVTHHAPHPGSIGAQYDANDGGLNALFASDMTDVLTGENAPDMWIHGATHVGVDYKVGRTRVLSNPMGYLYRAENPGFVPDLVVDPEARDYLPAY